MTYSNRIRKWFSTKLKVYEEVKNNTQNKKFNFTKQDRADYFFSHLEVVDRDFSAALYTYVDKYGKSATANELKYVAIIRYIYAWHKRFRLIKNDPFIGLVIEKADFPPTFDEVVDEYIEKVKGCKPTFSYKEVIDIDEEPKKKEEPKVNPLGIFV